MPPDERVAVFDNDGTLWCEKPMPIQLDFILRRLHEMAEAQPELRDRQPWKSAYDRDYTWLGAVLAAHYAGDDSDLGTVAAGVLAAHGGISVEEFERQAGDFLDAAQHPTLGRRYVETAYVPMIELLDLLTSCGFTNYIVSGGGRDFMRPISQSVYAVPRERRHRQQHRADVRGGRGGWRHPPQAGSRLPRRRAGEAGADLEPHRTPPAARGGELERRCPDARVHDPRRDTPTLRLLVLHDDAEREFAYTSGAEAALERAAADGWTIVSMKDDWGRCSESAAAGRCRH